MLRFFLFIFGTFFFVQVSWNQLKNPRSHGFYRFFVFESILALILLNHPYWLINVFSPLQLLSWVLLAVSIYFALHGLYLLKRMGGYADREDMPENFSFENTEKLVELGIYKYVRHPMYSSLLFLGWGAMLKNVTPLTFCLTLLATLMMSYAAKIEEGENIQFFGSSYEDYMTRTRKFVPFIY